MALMEGDWDPKTTKGKAMKIIRKGVRTALAALTSLVVGCCLLKAGLYDRCSYYDETIVTLCSVGTSTNGLVCIGTCSYVRFPQGTARCGFCAPAWVGYCNNTPTNTMVTVNTFVGNCIGPFQVPGGSETVIWECYCPDTYIFTGTTTVGCWCW